MIGVVLLVAAMIAGIVGRIAFISVSASAAVDHFYWILAARAYRNATKLPAIISNKYVLEDERQAYPPLFGWLLAKLPDRWISDSRIVWFVQGIDAVTLALTATYALASGAPALAVVVIMAVYATAPVLTTYNSQLTSRACGNLLLTAMLLSEAAAGQGTIGNIESQAMFVLAVLAAAGVVLTHKMSTQLMFLLWPMMPLALGDWRLLLVPPMGVLTATWLTGLEFAVLQWRAHADIVTFWHRHRDELGAHAFDHSPIYGEPGRVGERAFHKQGWRGIISHAALVIGYGPLVWLVPVSLFWTEAPQAFVVVWLMGTASFALATLYIPGLRCLGGGHLYIFNAIAPAALWWSTILPVFDVRTVALFSFGLAGTVASLAVGYQRRRKLAGSRDDDFQYALEHLRTLPASRVAVFPLTAVEEVAFRTPHAVMWGAHGYGFRMLEPIFPVIRTRLAPFLREHSCGLLLYDSRYWRAGDQVVAAEMPGADVAAFGRWRLVTLGFSLSAV